MQKEKPSTSSSPHATEAKQQRRKRIRKVLIVGGISVATLGIGYLAWRHFAPKPMETDEPGDGGKPHNLPQPVQSDDPPAHSPGSGGGATGTFRPDTNFPLTIYTKGEMVKNIQNGIFICIFIRPCCAQLR